MGVAKPEQLALDLDAARAARDHGIEAVGQSTDDWWRSCVDSAIDTLAAQGLPFSSDDVRELVTDTPHNDNAWGARFSAAAKRGVIAKVGYRQSSRVAGHARVITVWRGVGQGAS